MIDELELLRDHLEAAADPAPDLAPVRRRLLQAIDAEGPGPSSAPGPARDRRRPRRVAVALAALAGAAAAVLALGLPGQGPTPGPARPAATPTTHPFSNKLPVGDQLRMIADRVAAQPVPRLTDGQLLLTQAQLSVFASVNDGAAQATVPLSVQKWSTASGQTCTALTAQTAQFASAAQQSAWAGLGLRDLPQPSGSDQCLQGSAGTPPDAITGAGQVIDVSSLPTDPAALAQTLAASSTGIPALDQLTPDLAAPNPAFQRAAMLLIGPVTGATAQFDAALFQAIAFLPGVVALGPTTAHDGQAGQGYASGPGPGQTTIVVDPSDGRLLEVSGLDDSETLTGLAVNYLQGSPMQVFAYSTQLQWLDPVGTPAVVGFSALPPSMPTYVFAQAKPGVPVSQLTAVTGRLGLEYQRLTTSYDAWLPTPDEPDISPSFQWAFRPAAPTGPMVQALKASGLFATVSVI